MSVLLDHLASTLSEAESLQDLVRPALALLQHLTGFDSTYLAVVDSSLGVQRIRYAVNLGDLDIAEGLEVPWDDTLCKRALEEGKMFTSDVAAIWGDSTAARLLGIQSYVSAPVTIGNQVAATLCAASPRKLDMPAEALVALRLCAKLVAQQIERERILVQLRQANQDLVVMATADPLTGLPNRRVLQPELSRMLATAQRGGASVMVAAIDLDNFKSINDQYGHEAGDVLLCLIADQLRHVLRTTDLLARVGGDEFIVVGPGPRSQDTAEHDSQAWRARLADATRCTFTIGGKQISYAGASVGVTVSRGNVRDSRQLLREADEAMYAMKRLRKDDRAAFLAVA